MQNKTNGYFKKSKTLSTTDKKLASAMVQYVACDIHLFKAIEDQGFQNITCYFMKLGAQCGCIDLYSEIPFHRTVIMRNICSCCRFTDKVYFTCSCSNGRKWSCWCHH